MFVGQSDGHSHDPSGVGEVHETKRVHTCFDSGGNGLVPPLRGSSTLSSVNTVNHMQSSGRKPQKCVWGRIRVGGGHRFHLSHNLG